MNAQIRLTDEEKLEVATEAMQKAYDNLQEVFSQHNMMDVPIPEATEILRTALIQVKELSI